MIETPSTENGATFARAEGFRDHDRAFDCLQLAARVFGPELGAAAIVEAAAAFLKFVEVGDAS